MEVVIKLYFSTSPEGHDRTIIEALRASCEGQQVAVGAIIVIVDAMTTVNAVRAHGMSVISEEALAWVDWTIVHAISMPP